MAQISMRTQHHTWFEQKANRRRAGATDENVLQPAQLYIVKCLQPYVRDSLTDICSVHIYIHFI